MPEGFAKPSLSATFKDFKPQQNETNIILNNSAAIPTIGNDPKPKFFLFGCF